MTIGIDIEEFSVVELKQMVLALQERVRSESTRKQMDEIRIKALEMENAVLRDILARQIIGLVVAPTMLSSGMIGNAEREEETGEEEEEAKPVQTDGSDKDKFQA